MPNKFNMINLKDVIREMSEKSYAGAMNVTAKFLKHFDENVEEYIKGAVWRGENKIKVCEFKCACDFCFIPDDSIKYKDSIRYKNNDHAAIPYNGIKTYLIREYPDFKFTFDEFKDGATFTMSWD